jgi:hypothetical protein
MRLQDLGIDKAVKDSSTTSHSEIDPDQTDPLNTL